MYKIVHIFDDAIISKSTIELFQKLRGYNQTFAVVVLPNEADRVSQEITDASIIQLKYNKNLTSQIKVLIETNDIIICQALSFEKSKAIISKKYRNKVFIWGLWGYDLYNFVNYTQKNPDNVFETTSTKNKKLKQQFLDFYTYRIIYTKAIQKIDICLFFLESDFHLLTSVINHKAAWHTSCYQTLDNLYGQSEPYEVTGNSILIGNSSTPSNRHKVIFESLQNINISDRKLVVPLSYGDLEYRKEIIEFGKNAYNSQFVPLLDYMSLNSYIDVLSKCSHVILGHKRQQGFGTILMMLLAGSKIYLSNESPLFKWLKSKKCNVFSIENDLENESFDNFDDVLKAENRQIISSIIAEDVILEQLNQLLDKAIKIAETRKK